MKAKLRVALQGRGETKDQAWELDAAPGTQRRAIVLPLSERIAAGRHVFTLHGVADGRLDPSDAFVVVDVSR